MHQVADGLAPFFFLNENIQFPMELGYHCDDLLIVNDYVKCGCLCFIIYDCCCEESAIACFKYNLERKKIIR